MKVLQSARRHVAGADVRHAVHHQVVAFDLDGGDGRVLTIGPTRGGLPLEVMIQERFDEEPVAFHAMLLRPRYADLLPPDPDAGPHAVTGPIPETP